MAQGRSLSGRSLQREIRYNEFRYSESSLQALGTRHPALCSAGVTPIVNQDVKSLPPCMLRQGSVRDIVSVLRCMGSCESC
jgi:hypothetical protein